MGPARRSLLLAALLPAALPSQENGGRLPFVAPPDLPEAPPGPAASARALRAAPLGQIDHVVQQAIAAGAFPAAAVVVGRHDGIAYARGFGTLDWRRSTPVDADRTLFDVASITKVAATASAVMLLVDRGVLRLEDPVGAYLPSWRSGARSRITIADLLTHQAGLPAGPAFNYRRTTPQRARESVLRTMPRWEAGTHTQYSDVGPMVLGFVIEAATGEPLDRFVRQSLFEPLGMRSTGFRPSAGWRERAAPTGGTWGGVVHDGNARALGGVAGHAGLFTTATDLARLAQLLLGGGVLDRERFVGPATVARFTLRRAGWRAPGWDTCAGGGSCGAILGGSAIGHTGFTGTSIWIDPARDLFVIVLTNYVHGGRDGRTAPLAVLRDVQADVADLAAMSVPGSHDRPFPLRLRTELQVGWRR